MPEQRESLVQTALRELSSLTCGCGEPKLRNRSFCSGCYFALPPNLRGSLYKTILDGYAEAYDEAKDWLRINTERLTGK